MLPYLALAAVGCTHLALVVIGQLRPRSAADGLVVGLEFLLLDGLLLALAVRAAFHPRLGPGVRRSWRRFAGALTLLVAGGWVYGVANAHGVASAGFAPLVGFWTVMRMGQVALMLAGFMSLADQPLTPRARLKLWLDLTTVVGGGLTGIWYLVGPVFASDHGVAGLVRLLAVSWLVGDLVMLVGLSTVLVRGTAPGSGLPMRLLLSGTVAYFVVDLCQVWQIMFHPESPQLEVVAFISMLMNGLYAAAALEQCRQADPEKRVRAGRSREHPAVPYVALFAGYALLGVAAARFGGYAWPGLVAGAATMTACLAGRQLIMVRENRDLASTDALTGLANRLPVRAELERCLARSRRSGRPTGILILDLDGFKQVNDECGHEVGDATLRRFAAVLTAQVRTTDLAARLGGDEFLMLLEDVTAVRAVDVARRVQAAAADPGPDGADRPPIRCSVGIALADPIDLAGMPAPEELLRRADQAMYAAKREGRHGWQLYRPGMAPDRSGTEPARIGG